LQSAELTNPASILQPPAAKEVLKAVGFKPINHCRMPMIEEQPDRRRTRNESGTVPSYLCKSV
jgi:hypothetical protein